MSTLSGEERAPLARGSRAAVPAFLAVYALAALPLLWTGPAVRPALLGASIVLAVVLCVLSAIDLASWRLPDTLTLPLIAAGPLVLHYAGGGPVWWSAASAAIGFAALAALAFAYRRLRGSDGLGLGDAKLLAAAGAWLGAEHLPAVVLWAAGAALACVAVSALRGRPFASTDRIAFGPFLAFAYWLAWLYGPP